ncbi:MAG: LssY C-terminal domain-containing protein, partial [Thiohalocapsa sp.]
WAPAYLAPGIVFGASIKLAAEAAGRVAVLLLVLLSLVWLSLWAAKRLFGVLSPHASDWVRRLLRWADLHPSMGRVAYALADPSHPDAITLTGLAAALLGATAVAGITIGAGLIGGGSPLWLNRVALDLGQSLHTPLADALMIRLNTLGSWTVLGVLWIGVLLYLLGRGQRREAMYWLAASGFVLVAAPVLGPLLQVSRPSLGLDLFWPWSFPSPPALGATLTYGFAAIMLSRDLPAGGRWIPYALAALLVLAVAVARLYFGAEWLTDIIGSVALGLVWISAIGLAFRRHSARIQPGLGLPLAAGISLLGALTLAGAIDARHGLDRYVPSPALERISVAQWQRRGCDLLPQHRRDLWHRDGRPFQIAYAGDLGALAEALRGLGWRRAERLSWGNALKLLSPSTPLAELPIIPHVHDGHHEELALVKDLSADRRIVLRLWSTQCRIDQDVTIYVGKATLLEKESVVDLIALPLTARNLGEPKRSLHDDLAAAPGLRVDTGAPTLVATAGSGLLP